MGFNSGFKGLITYNIYLIELHYLAGTSLPFCLELPLTWLQFYFQVNSIQTYLQLCYTYKYMCRLTSLLYSCFCLYIQITVDVSINCALCVFTGVVIACQKFTYVLQEHSKCICDPYYILKMEETHCFETLVNAQQNV